MYLYMHAVFYFYYVVPLVLAIQSSNAIQLYHYLLTSGIKGKKTKSLSAFMNKSILALRRRKNFIMQLFYVKIIGPIFFR